MHEKQQHQVDQLIKQSDYNTMAIKMMLDAQMIDQLMQRQEVEDKNRILMLGTDTLNPIKPTAGEQRRAKSTLKPRNNAEADNKNGIPIIPLLE